MPSIDALVSAIDTVSEQIEAVNRSIVASLSTTVELSGQFRMLGATDKAGQAEQITQALEEQQARALAAVQQAEAARAQAEALRGPGGPGRGGTPPGPPPAPFTPQPEPNGWNSAPDLTASRDGMPRLGDVTAGRRVHILDGDGDGESGGHRWDSEVPDKTKFPYEWDDDKIIGEIGNVAKHPDKTPTARRRGGWICEGTRDGVTIEVVINHDGSVWTGYPLRGPGVERNRGEW